MTVVETALRKLSRHANPVEPTREEVARVRGKEPHDAPPLVRLGQGSYERDYNPKVKGTR